jgi:hypothetical protein
MSVDLISDSGGTKIAERTWERRLSEIRRFTIKEA